MELGLHVADFTWPNGPANLAKDLTRITATAEDAGFTKLSVMDHVWQIHLVGPPEQLLAWVTAAVYRQPGLLAKAVTTLDVLSEGRAWLGIGAAWNQEEARGLGLPFPPAAAR